MTQDFLISTLSEKNPTAVIIGSLGTIGTSLSRSPHKEKIIVKGAMGCVMGVGLGYALNTDKQVIVLIGDGAFLMKAGSVATILQHAPKNLSIYILDNGQYASCGGQETYFNKFPQLPEPFRVERITCE